MKLSALTAGTHSQNTDWDLNPGHPVSGLTEVQVLPASVQKEFSERPSERQEIDLLGWDACERCKRAGKKALPPGSGGLQFYYPSGVGVGKAHLFLFLLIVAPP